MLHLEGFLNARSLLTFDKLTFTGILMALSSTSILSLFGYPILAGSLLGSLGGVVLGAGIPWVTMEGYYRLRNVEAIGMGTVKLFGMIGAFVGVKVVVIFAASLPSALLGCGHS
jgi:prepilin signal peptidase PulO-like enzyme (type II secretory pathway)